ncbi:hypothetical protein [Halobellus salinus]|uniref:hypothetical protein n=1 Tax=Halobellus salinus TaxID=931585 RepID=UPI00166EDF9E|nr:hypothetical protein [Halobellus salinus]
MVYGFASTTVRTSCVGRGGGGRELERGAGAIERRVERLDRVGSGAVVGIDTENAACHRWVAE